jgi:hypothetical protein
MGLLTDGYGVTGVEVVKSKTGNLISLSEIYRVAETNADNGDRDNEIVPGRFYVELSDGSVDGAVAADFTSGATRKIKGLCAKVMSSKGGVLDSPYLSKDMAGLIQGYEDLANLVFRGWLDEAVASTTIGSVAIDDAAVVDATNTDTFTPEPYAPDRLDGSTYSATSTTHACALMGKDPDPKNQNADALVVLFMINSGFRATTN